MILWVCSPPLPRFTHARYRQEMLDANGKNNEGRVMIVSTLCLDCKSICDWPSFHAEFCRVFGFPSFYGYNMDAWIDCMSSLDAPEDGLSSVHCSRGMVLTLDLKNMKEFKERCQEQYDALIECAAFVNWRRIATGGSSVLALSFHE